MFPMNPDRGTAGERGRGPKRGPQHGPTRPLLRTDRKTNCLRLLPLRSRAIVATPHPSRLQRRQLRTTDISQT